MPAASVFLLLAALQQPALQPRDVHSAPDGAVISGRVTERSSGRSLPRIVVTLTRIGSSMPQVSVTDDDGRYEFTELEPGEYALSAGPDQHRSTYLHQRYGADAPGLPDVEPPRPNLVLAAGERRSGLDIALWRALAIEGRVLDPRENGMASKTVLVKRIDGRVRFAASATTDDRGMYRAFGLAPGRYRACTEIEQDSDAASDSMRLGSTCYPAAANEGGGGEIVLTSQDATGIDIRVQQFRSYSISGFVVGSTGSPVDDAFVGAYSLDDSGQSVSGTTRRGEFVLNGLAPGRYVLQASLAEPNPGDRRPYRDLEVGYASVDVIGGDAAGLTVSLSKPVDVSGRVRFDGGGPPSSRRLGMVVQTAPAVERLAFSMPGGRPPFSPVNDDLSFELKGVSRLPMIVRVIGLPDGWVLKSVLYGRRDIMYVPTEFGSGPSPEPLELIVTNRVAEPMLRVVNEEGRAITSCQVIAIPADPARWRLALGFAAATPAPGGLMRLGPMLPGEYIVAAIPLDEGAVLFNDPTRVDALAAIGRRVTLAEGDHRTLDVRLVSLPSKQ